MHKNTFSLKSFGIRQLLIISYLLVLIIPSTLQILLNSHFITTYKRELANSDRFLLNDYKITIEYYLRDIINISSIIYGPEEYLKILKKPDGLPQLEIFQDNKFFQDYFQQVLYRDHVRGIYIYTTSLKRFVANGNFGFANLEENLQEGTWLSSIMQQEGELFFLPTHEPKQLTDGFPVFSLVRKIRNPDTREIIALMLIDIDPEVFRRTAINKDMRPNTQFIVTDKNNDIIFHSDNKVAMGKVDEIYLQSGMDDIIENFIYTQDNDKRLVSYTKSNIADWNIYVESPLNVVEQRAVILRNLILVASGIGFLIAILTAITFSSLISNPIQKLTLNMANIEKDNFKTHPTLNSSREIYLLTSRFNKMVTRMKYLLHNEFQLKLLKKDAEFKALQAQINPHFLYNTLETISSIAEIKNVPEISKTCLELSNMFRYSIGTKKDIVPLSYEIKHMMNYIAIMQIRYENKINLEINIPESLKQYSILKLTLQPLVENCINHGYDEITSEDRITVEAYKTDNDIRISISDTGKGFSDNKIKSIMDNLKEMTYDNIRQKWNETSHKSIGIGNIHMRYALYYGPQYGIINIENLNPKGSRITILLPAHKK